jgi:hypothetical protein
MQSKYRRRFEFTCVAETRTGKRGRSQRIGVHKTHDDSNYATGGERDETNIQPSSLLHSLENGWEREKKNHRRETILRYRIYCNEADRKRKAAHTIWRCA